MTTLVNNVHKLFFANGSSWSTPRGNTQVRNNNNKRLICAKPVVLVIYHWITDFMASSFFLQLHSWSLFFLCHLMAIKRLQQRWRSHIQYNSMIFWWWWWWRQRWWCDWAGQSVIEKVLFSLNLNCVSFNHHRFHYGLQKNSLSFLFEAMKYFYVVVAVLVAINPLNFVVSGSYFTIENPLLDLWQEEWQWITINNFFILSSQK